MSSTSITAYEDDTLRAMEPSPSKALKLKPELNLYDDVEARRRYLRRKSWFEMESHRQEINRYQMALDEGYYDGEHWTAAEQAELHRRKQAPIVFNEMKPTIDWLIGTERRMRRDFKVLSRNSSAKEAGDAAETKTKLLKYLDDVNRTPFQRSQAFDDMAKAGLGWIEVGIRTDPEDEAIYTRHESWRYMLHDSLGTTGPDLDGCRFVFRIRPADLDVAKMYFPGNDGKFERAATCDDDGGNEDWLNGWPTLGVMGRSSTTDSRYLQYESEALLYNPRRRVLLIECWELMPTRETRAGGASSYDRTLMKMHVSIMTQYDTLFEAPSPYKHNKFPFVPLWAYRRKRDGLPYGPLRQLRGPQDDLNKRMSKAQFLLSVNQVSIEKSALDKSVMTVEELQRRMAAPDGVMVFAEGALSGNKVVVREHGDIAQGHIVLADRDAVAIRSMSGVTGENRSMDTNATSGKAIGLKQEQGSMLTAELFDNRLLAHQMEGDLTVSLIEQFYTEEKTFSITGERYKQDFITINGTDPVSGARINDISAHKAAFVIGEAPWRQALAEAAFEHAMEMLAQLAPVAPQVVTAILDLVFEWSDLPNKQLILTRIREVTGMADPDAGETPEQQKAKQEKLMVEAAQFAAQMAQLQADVKKAEAAGEKLNAEAMAKRLEALYLSAQAAQVLAMAPQITPVADELLMSAGFKDANAPQVLPDQMAQQQPAQPAMPGMDPGPQIPEAQQLDGAMAGSETPRADGLIPQQEQPQ